MKKIILFAAVLTVFTACDNKAEREAEIEAATQAAIDSVNAITERERLYDSMNAVSVADPSVAPPPVIIQGETKSPGKPRAGKKDQPGKTDQGTVGTNTSVPVVTPTTTEQDKTVVDADEPPAEGETPATAEEKKKKGVNNTVKGAIIGAGAGAVGGAIINKKNPGKGAIIGGVVGAGAGAVTGVILDKNKKKKQAEKDSAAKATTSKEPAPTGTTNP